MRIGVHVSISGKIFNSIDRAKALGCSAMQIFSHNPRGWKVPPLYDDDVKIFREKLKKSGINPLVVHTSYLINLASPDDGLYERSIESFKFDLERADRLGATFLVTHLGSSRDKDLQYGIKRVCDALNLVLKNDGNRDVKILLENTAGSGSTIGYNLHQIKEIIDAVNDGDSLGLCFDTCHGFASGYDFRDVRSLDTLVEEIGSVLGLDRLELIHLNDSKEDIGTGIDRHEHIGEGKIGIKGFKLLINHPLLRNIPMILETPKKSDKDDIRNLSVVKKLRKRGL
ncbi:MAG: deoxyribonuclease IV [Pseudomonadota bacterium]